MFCYQCEQAAKGVACTIQGVCGKKPEVAALQDLLIYSLQGLSQVAVEGRKVGVSDPEVNIFTCKAAFSTLTNVDFDPQRFVKLIQQGCAQQEIAHFRSLPVQHLLAEIIEENFPQEIRCIPCFLSCTYARDRFWLSLDFLQPHFGIARRIAGVFITAGIIENLILSRIVRVFQTLNAL